MTEDKFSEPRLTRKEIRFIKLFRTQSEESRQEIIQKISEIYEDHKIILSDDFQDKNDEKAAFWLNSDFYKK